MDDHNFSLRSRRQSKAWGGARRRGTPGARRNQSHQAREAGGGFLLFARSLSSILDINLHSSVAALAILAVLHLGSSGGALINQPPVEVMWTFDRLENIGGHKTTVLGHPKVIDSPVGKAVEFNGVDDALFIDNHPLAGAGTYTWEAIFRPDGGQREQRWFHLSEQDPR